MNRCEANYRSPELDPIRNKVEFLRRNNEAPPPFEMAADESFASDVERKAIAQWAKLREACIAHEEAAQPLPPGLSPLQVTYYENTRAFSREAGAKVSELVVFLYQQKLTYGKFAKKRYEITRDLASAERRFRESTLISDMGRQTEAHRLAQQEFRNNLAAWTAYNQAVSVRQPQSVRVNCTSRRYGNTVTTNCN